MLSFGKIVFLGAGSMAEAIISGIIGHKLVPNDQIVAINRTNKKRLTFLSQTYGIQTTQDKSAIQNANIVILAMKPKDVINSLTSIKPFVHDNQLFISVVAGVSLDILEQQLGLNAAVIRTMPNTSATLGLSATGLSKGHFVTDQQLKQALSLFKTVGIVAEVKEEELHAITGLSGSGPAYIYYLAEAMEEAACKLGLDPDVAKSFMIQTLKGSCEMLEKSGKSAATLRKEVTSPNGTTEAGLAVLDTYHVNEAMIECIHRATKRSIELGNELKNSLQ